jgi:hypothetical protein
MTSYVIFLHKGESKVLSDVSRLHIEYQRGSYYGSLQIQAQVLTYSQCIEHSGVDICYKITT